MNNTSMAKSYARRQKQRDKYKLRNIKRKIFPIFMKACNNNDVEMVRKIISDIHDDTWNEHGILIAIRNRYSDLLDVLLFYIRDKTSIREKLSVSHDFDYIDYYYNNSIQYALAKVKDVKLYDIFVQYELLDYWEVILHAFGEGDIKTITYITDKIEQKIPNFECFASLEEYVTEMFTRLRVARCGRFSKNDVRESGKCILRITRIILSMMDKLHITFIKENLDDCFTNSVIYGSVELCEFFVNLGANNYIGCFWRLMFDTYNNNVYDEGVIKLLMKKTTSMFDLYMREAINNLIPEIVIALLNDGVKFPIIDIPSKNVAFLINRGVDVNLIPEQYKCKLIKDRVIYNFMIKNTLLNCTYLNSDVINCMLEYTPYYENDETLITKESREIIW